MQNNNLESHPVDLTHADNLYLVELRNNHWISKVYADNDQETAQALDGDAGRIQFLVKGKKFMEHLEDLKQTNSKTDNLTALLYYLKATFQDVVPLSQINEDFERLTKIWNQDIGAMAVKAIKSSLNSSLDTAHIYALCDYTTDLTYENGKMILDVRWHNFDFVNGETLEKVPFPSTQVTARWELSEDGFKLQKIEGNNADLIALVENASVPANSHLFDDPRFKSKTMIAREKAADYLHSKKTQIEALWNGGAVIPETEAERGKLPLGVRTIYEKALEAEKPHADVIKLAKEVRQTWGAKKQLRDSIENSLFGASARKIAEISKHRDRHSKEFYQETKPTTPTKKSN